MHSLSKRLLSVVLSLTVVFSVMAGFSTQVYALKPKTDKFDKSYVLTGNGAQDIVNVALKQKGKTNSDFGYEAGWCSAFVSDCANLAGQSKAVPWKGNQEDLKNAVISAGGKQIYRMSGSYSEKGFTDAKVGDLVFINWNNSNASGTEHVEIVYKTDNGKIFTVGGNTDAGVKVRDRCTQNQYEKTVWVVRPAYSGSSIPVDNTTYADFINLEAKGNIPFVKDKNDRIDVSIQGRNLKIKIRSDSFNNGKVKAYCEKEEHKNGFRLLSLYINDFVFDPKVQPSSNNHTLCFDIDCPTPSQHDKNGYVSVDKLEYNLGYVTSYAMSKNADEYADEYRDYTSITIFYNKPTDSNVTSKPMKVSYSGNTIVFEGTIPYSNIRETEDVKRYSSDEVIYSFNNKNLSLYLWYYGLGLNYSKTNNSGNKTIMGGFVDFFNSLVENARNTILTVFEAFKKVFSLDFSS